jgi:lipoprotein signal peptidase
MTKLEMLDNLSWRLSEDTIVTIDDFFSVTARDEGVSLSFMSRQQHKVSFSEVVKSIKAIRMYSFVENFECKWNEEQDWYEIEFKMITDSGNYKVEIVLH